MGELYFGWALACFMVTFGSLLRGDIPREDVPAAMIASAIASAAWPLTLVVLIWSAVAERLSPTSEPKTF